jgi:hypothetical protein
MFYRSTNRKKGGKDHRYFSMVENRHLPGDKTVQRTGLCLGEINDQQQAAWLKTLEVFEEEDRRYTTTSLFPDDWELPADALESVQVRFGRAGVAAAADFRQPLAGVRAVASIGAG